MPRQGDGSSDNGPFEEAGSNLIHGNSGDTSINRASKTAPMPEQEKGDGLPGMNASGGGSRGLDGGQGGADDPNKPPTVDQVTKQA